MTPLLYAVRQGYIDVAMTLLDAGVDVNQRKGGDNASALLVATVNGQFDLAAHAARARRQSEPGGRERRGPLYAAINLKWAPRGRLSAAAGAAAIRGSSYLDLMKRAARRRRRSERASDEEGLVHELQLRSSPASTKPARRAFWRAAYGARRRRDEAAGRRYGADPNIPTIEAARTPANRRRRPPSARGRLGHARDPDRRSRRAAAARRGRRRLRRRLRRQLASPRARRHARRGEVSGRGARRGRQRRAITRATRRSTTPRRAATTR